MIMSSWDTSGPFTFELDKKMTFFSSEPLRGEIELSTKFAKAIFIEVLANFDQKTKK
jgi:hypothetical protein